MLRLGIIPDAHGDSRAVFRLIKKCEKEGADAIFLAGDLGFAFKEIDRVLKAASNAKVPVFAFPGSHEPEEGYYKAMKKHRKIIDSTKKPRITIKGNDVIVIPGSSVNTQRTGFRIIDNSRLSKEYLRLFRTYKARNFSKYIRNPAKTALLCHDPPKCTTKSGIDLAYSGLVRKTFLLKVKHIQAFRKIYRHSRDSLALLYNKGEIINAILSKELVKRGYPVSLIYRNAGNPELRKLMKARKIRFFACGHIHEAGQKAMTASGKQLKPGIWSDSVWYNASGAIEGTCGMLIIETGRGMFKNIRA